MDLETVVFDTLDEEVAGVHVVQLADGIEQGWGHVHLGEDVEEVLVV